MSRHIAQSFFAAWQKSCGKGYAILSASLFLAMASPILIGCVREPELHLHDGGDVVIKMPIVHLELDVFWDYVSELGIPYDWTKEWYYGWDDYDKELFGNLGYEEPDAFKEMLEYVSEFYLEVMKQEIYYCKPDLFGMMDDDAAYHAPFFSLDMYREFFKPLQQKHIDLAKENGMLVTRHDCGKCEQFVPDWIEMDVRAWNPAQVSNDLVGIKKKYGNAIALEGAWDSQGELGRADCDIQTLKDALAVYVDTFAPGGGFTYSAHLSGVDQKDPRVIERNNYMNKKDRLAKRSFSFM